MPISLDQIKWELWPGLAAVGGRYFDLARLKTEGMSFPFDGYDWELATPWLWVPKPVELVAAAAALAVVKNPVVTRRFWQGWLT